MDSKLIPTQVTWEIQCFWCYSQFKLNNRRLFVLNVALIWHLNVLIPVQITKCAFVNIWPEWAAGLVKWIRSSKIYFNLNLLLVFSCLGDTFCVRILWPFAFQQHFNHVERERGGVINRIRTQVMVEIKQSHEKKKKSEIKIAKVKTSKQIEWKAAAQSWE